MRNSSDFFRQRYCRSRNVVEVFSTFSLFALSNKPETNQNREILDNMADVVEGSSPSDQQDSTIDFAVLLQQLRQHTGMFVIPNGESQQILNQPSEELRAMEHSTVNTIDSSDINMNDEEIQEDNSGTDSGLAETRDYDIEIFIEELKDLPCLWNTSAVSYKDRNCKINAWRKLAQMFNKDVDFLKQEYKKLKDNLKKCLDQRERATKSGAAASKLSKCKYFDQLSFLCDKTTNKPTESNVIIPCHDNTDTSNVSSSSSCESDPQPLIGESTCKRKSSTEIPHGKNAKSRAELAHTVDSMLVKTLQDMSKGENSQVHLEEDEDSLYCRSLIPILRELPLKKKRLAKLKIDELLYKIEFDSDS